MRVINCLIRIIEIDYFMSIYGFRSVTAGKLIILSYYALDVPFSASSWTFILRFRFFN